MRMRSILAAILCGGLLGPAWGREAPPEAAANTLTPAADGRKISFRFGGKDNGEFLLGGRPFQIRAGEMHPQRIPKEYWRHRIRAARAMGLNTISFYTFWNDFEQPGGNFDFKTGSRDIAGFLRICREEGMWALFRPGPYVCGEWDFGGLPAYLLKEGDAPLRTTKNKVFMRAQTRYLEAIARVVEPFLCKNGGPVLMTQIENEYGSYNGEPEREYVEWLHRWWKKRGFGPFYTSDGSSPGHLRYTLPGAAVGLDPGENDGHWAAARKANPGVPVFSSETYPGWLRHWGEGDWAASPGILRTVRWFMDTGRSFSLYVFHGGTSFGKTAGANAAGEKYQPDLTSYDYGAPLDESGKTTPEYHRLRAVIQDGLPDGVALPDPPSPVETMELPAFTPEREAGLWELLPAPAVGKTAEPPWFESFGQNQGLAVYSASAPAGPEARLEFEHVHDYALVYLDGKRVGTLDRRRAERSLTLPARSGPARLDVVVDAMGHINFHADMERDRKGLFGKATLGGRKLGGWTVRPLALDAVPRLPRAAKAGRRGVGALFRARLTLGAPKDTFLDMSRYIRGYVWVNGRCLGRYWNVGPQLRLYCPAPFLREGGNEITVLDLEMDEAQPIRGMRDRNREAGNAEAENLNNDW